MTAQPRRQADENYDPIKAELEAVRAAADPLGRAGGDMAGCGFRLKSKAPPIPAIHRSFFSRGGRRGRKQRSAAWEVTLTALPAMPISAMARRIGGW